MPAFLGNTSKWKLLVPTLLFFLCIAAAFAAIYVRSNEFRASKEEDFALKAQRVANSLEAQIFERFADSQAFALNSALISAVSRPHPAATERAVTALDKLGSIYKVYQALVLTDRDGAIVAVNSRTPDGAPIPREHWRGFQGEKASEWVQGKEEKTRIKEITDAAVRNRYFGGIPVHSYSSAIHDESGRPIGVITNYTNGLLLEREMHLILEKLRKTYDMPLKIALVSEKNQPFASFGAHEVEYFPSSLSASVHAGTPGAVTYDQDSILAHAEVNDARVPGFPRWKIVLVGVKKIFLAEIRTLYLITNFLAGLVLLMLAYSVSIFFRLQASHKKELMDRLVQAQETERARISREIHDEIGQNLSAIKIHIQALEAKDPELLKVREMLVDTIDSVRRVSHDLHPSVIENLGLEAAIAWKLRAFAEDTGMRTSLNVADGAYLDKLPKALTSHLYRIFLEALHNAQKHSDASELKVAINQGPRKIQLHISDNGVGFSDRKNQAGIGLASIRERAMLCGGSASIQSMPDKGTRIVCEIPFLS